MNTVALWFLVTVSNHKQVVYSPPMPDLQTCQFVQQNVGETARSLETIKSQCIQIKTVVLK